MGINNLGFNYEQYPIKNLPGLVLESMIPINIMLVGYHFKEKSIPFVDSHGHLSHTHLGQLFCSLFLYPHPFLHPNDLVHLGIHYSVLALNLKP
jgi:hypothetical protein